jgi:hypothetical protein
MAQVGAAPRNLQNVARIVTKNASLAGHLVKKLHISASAIILCTAASYRRWELGESIVPKRATVSRGIRTSESPSATMQRPLMRSPCSSGIFACKPNHHGSEQTARNHGEDREAYCRRDLHSTIGGSLHPSLLSGALMSLKAHACASKCKRFYVGCTMRGASVVSLAPAVRRPTPCGITPLAPASCEEGLHRRSA